MVGGCKVTEMQNEFSRMPTLRANNSNVKETKANTRKKHETSKFNTAG